MAILTKPTISKGQANEFDLSKSDLAAVSKVVNDSYFSDQTNWSKVIVEYKSAEGNQHEMVIFDASEASPKGNFEVSEKARDSWEVQSVKIMDFDGGYLKLGRGDLTVADFDIALGSVGGDVGGSVGAIYTAFNYLNVLRPDQLDGRDSFGHSVAISGNYIVVSAIGDNTVYVFKINSDNTISLLETGILRPDVVSYYDRFGQSVSISGNHIVVGSTFAGEAYVYRINGDDISLLEILKPDGLSSSSGFGQHVAISGNYIVVSSGYDDSSVYVFKINGDDPISLLETLRPDGIEIYDQFAQNGIDISGNYIVVSADEDSGVDDSSFRSGAAYVFKINDNDTISLLKTLRPDELDPGDYFGSSVSISGNYIVVGADRDGGPDNSRYYTGAAYVFKINGDDISLLEILKPDELDGGDYLGRSVSISGNYIVLGVASDGGVDNSKYGSGAAYIYRINDGDTITSLNTLRPDELEYYDQFGKSVAISGDYIIVGAANDDGADNSQDFIGATYVFKGVE